MAVMRHGEAAPEVFNLDLKEPDARAIRVNVCVASETLLNCIRNDDLWNMLIRYMALYELLHKLGHHSALGDSSVYMHLLLQKQMLTIIRGKVVASQLNVDAYKA